MKTTLCLAAVALIAAGCAASPNTQVAQAECKIAPATTRSAASARAQPVDKLDQRRAEADLATSDIRRANLAHTPGIHGNLLEEALRDCRNAR